MAAAGSIGEAAVMTVHEGLMAPNGLRLVNVVSACLILGVSRPTLYRWMHDGLVQWVSMPSGRGRRIVLDSLWKVQA